MNSPTDRERPALSEGDQDIMASRDLATPTCSALEFLNSVAAVPMQDIDLSYLATNVLYARGSIAKEVRREAVTAIETLRDILSSAKRIAGESSRDDHKLALTQVEPMTPENSPALAKAIHDLSVFAYRHAPDAEVAEWEGLVTTVTAELDACNAALSASPKPALTQGGGELVDQVFPRLAGTAAGRTGRLAIEAVVKATAAAPQPLPVEVERESLVWPDDVLDRVEEWVNRKGGEADVRDIAAALIAAAHPALGGGGR